MQVHTQSHPTWSSDNRQLAAKTPLGWVVMGRPAHHTSPLSKDMQKQPHIQRNVSLLHQSTTTPTTPPSRFPDNYATTTKPNSKSTFFTKPQGLLNPNYKSCSSTAALQHPTLPFNRAAIPASSLALSSPKTHPLQKRAKRNLPTNKNNSINTTHTYDTITPPTTNPTTTISNAEASQFVQK